VQRKIFHLLANNGLSGREFRYLLKVNPKHAFNWNEPLLITDKIDGTTAQADSEHIYKRRDTFKKGDPQKFKAPETERYFLEQLDETSPQNRWIFQAYSRYKDRFSKIPPSYTVYFECFGDKIQERYKNMPPDIRVFDITHDEEFVPFETTLAFCNTYHLPLVGFQYRTFSHVSEIVDLLAQATHIDPLLGQYELEGWVLRQQDQIAKIRKADLKILLS